MIHNAAPGNPGRIEGVKLTVSSVRAALPDPKFTAEDLIAKGDKVVQLWSMTGTQKGEFMGAPPTGKKDDVQRHFDRACREWQGRGDLERNVPRELKQFELSQQAGAAPS